LNFGCSSFKVESWTFKVYRSYFEPGLSTLNLPARNFELRVSYFDHGFMYSYQLFCYAFRVFLHDRRHVLTIIPPVLTRRWILRGFFFTTKSTKCHEEGSNPQIHVFLLPQRRIFAD